MAKIKAAPFEKYVDARGYYTKEYINWAIQRDNFVDSDLQRSTDSDAPARVFGNVEYVRLGVASTSPESAESNANKIRKLGGLARVTSIRRNKKPMFAIWFNPNGSMKAYDWVSGW
jgi:hypothetical protein